MSGKPEVMRDVLLRQIYDKMSEKEDIFFLTADFGSPVLDGIKNDFDDRCINTGIAEQNLINVSTGLALEGYTVYAYAIAPFLTMRAYEQIRVNLSISAHNKEININLIGVGAGVSYDVSGPTHHCFEDLTIMRLLPNMMVFSPSDPVMVKQFFNLTLNRKEPKYIRLDGKPLPSIYSDSDDISFDDGFHPLLEGDRLCLVSTGYMTHKALKTVRAVQKSGNSIGVLDIFLLKPIDEDKLYEQLKKYKYIITIEEGFIKRGGLDSMILNILQNNRSDIRVKSLGFNDKFVFDMGDREYLYKQTGLDDDTIVNTVEELMREESS